jgi:hypothetical protein
LDSTGEPKQYLSHGEYKSLATDRVVLVPGFTEEVECVRHIYRMFTKEQFTVYRIARVLNEKGLRYRGNSKWCYTSVHQILSHPKYAGCNVFGRTSQRLGARPVRLPQSEWVMASDAFVPIVEKETFDEAQRLLLDRTTNKTDGQLLDALRVLLAREGRLSMQLIKHSSDLPSPSAYRGRFGSLRKAYSLIGYGPAKDFKAVDVRRRTQALREELLARIQSVFPEEISIVRRGGRWRSCLLMRDGTQSTILVCRQISGKDAARWIVDPVHHELGCVTLLALLDKTNEFVQTVFVLPRLDRKNRFHLTLNHQLLKGTKRLNAFSELLGAVEDCLLRPGRRL